MLTFWRKYTKIVYMAVAYLTKISHKKEVSVRIPLLRANENSLNHWQTSYPSRVTGPPLASIFACAAAKRAIGTRYGEHDT